MVIDKRDFMLKTSKPNKTSLSCAQETGCALSSECKRHTAYRSSLYPQATSLARHSHAARLRPSSIAGTAVLMQTISIGQGSIAANSVDMDSGPESTAPFGDGACFKGCI